MKDSPTTVDDHFLEALLHEAYHPTPIEGIVEKVMSQLDAPAVIQPAVQHQRRDRTGWYSAIFTMLAGVILLSLLAVWPAETSASETLRQVIAAAEVHDDREYDITTQGRINISAKLWVQGGDRFVLRLPAIVPGRDNFVWLGSNGNDFWFIPALGPVVVQRDPEWLHRLLEQQQQLSLPILHVSTITRRLQSRYNTPQLIPDAPGLVHLQSEQQAPVTRSLPHRVDIFARNNIIEKLLLHWNETTNSNQPFDMTLTLNPTSTLPVNWYDHAAHHVAALRVVPAQEE